MLVESSVIGASSLSSMTLTGWRLLSERRGPMRTMLTGLAATAVGSARIWRNRAAYAALCTTAVLFGWLAIRLWVTYLPPLPPVAAYDFLGGYTVDQTAATVQCAPVDLRVRGADRRSHWARDRSRDRQGRRPRRHGNPRRLRSEVIARFAEWPISRKLGAGSSSWQVRGRRSIASPRPTTVNWRRRGTPTWIWGAKSRS